ncbi:MAG: rRNA maturation RNase YbeY [Deltaproteobacteria bacterium]|nr:rRNA maturation RNase YbeY [Deltaproteobacteria bacterium]
MSRRKPSSKRAWKINLLIHTSNYVFRKQILKTLAKEILSLLDAGHLPLGMKEVNIVLTDDEQIKDLNATYRGKNRPTDVLSFCRTESPALPQPDPLLGEIVISVETAERQAHKSRIDLDRELTRLMIHGILHLFGYDHEKVPAAKAREMRRLEDQIMKATRPL